MSVVDSVSVDRLDLPMSEPFEISLGTQREASNVLVTVETVDGAVGVGEGAPIPPVTGETQDAAIETAKTLATVVEGHPVGEYRRLGREIRATCPGMSSAAFAVETAVLDAYCRERGLPMAELFGGTANAVTTDLTIPILPAEEAGAAAAKAVDDGFSHLKIKTGTGVANDLTRVTAVAENAPDAELKVDANQGWTSKETVRFADGVADAGVDVALIEQPVPAADVRGLADCRRRVDLPIAADETVFTPEDAVRVVREEAADVINVKLGKSGPFGAADIVAIARAADLELMIGCMLESAVGIHTSAHLVSGTDAFSYVDLDGNLLLAEDVVDTEYGPTVDISGPGHGVTVDR